MSGAIKVDVDLSGLNEFLGGLEQDVQEALRPSALAGAEVLYRAVLHNVMAHQSPKGHWFYGTTFQKTRNKEDRYWFDAGTLMRSIYHAYATKEATDDRPVYSVGANPLKAPYAYMVEFGTSRAAPVRYIGRARDRIPAALDAAQKEFFNRLHQVK